MRYRWARHAYLLSYALLVLGMIFAVGILLAAVRQFPDTHNPWPVFMGGLVSVVWLAVAVVIAFFVPRSHL